MRTAATIVAALLMLALGLRLAWVAIVALRSGVARTADDREFKLKRSPLMYWLAIVVQSAFSATCIYAVFLAVSRLSE